MRFRLSSLLIFVTLFAVAVGLGYQVVLLRNEMAEVRNELKTLKQRPLTITVAQPVNPTPSPSSPFRLLDGATIEPEVERGMKADELQRRERLEKQLRLRMVPAPDLPKGYGTR